MKDPGNQYERFEEVPPQRPGRGLGAGMIVLAWVTVFGLLFLGFSDWAEKDRNPNQEVRSGFDQFGATEVVLQQNRYGHYVATGLINQVPVTFLLDTGATAVSVPGALSERLGLKRGPAVAASTANGTVTTYSTRLHRVALGDIELQDVRANINPHMEGDEVLLGMSFLRQLDFSQNNRELTLRRRP